MVTNPGPQGDIALGRAVFSDLVGRAFGGTEGPAVDGEALLAPLREQGIEDDSVPRLFALGYYDRADELPDPDRRAFHATMAPVIRWVESHVPHSLWPEVEARAQQPELDWMREVAALDLARQGDPWEAAGMRAPWLLAALEPQSPGGSIDELPSPHAAARLRRVLLTPDHRFAVVRRIAAEARDVRLVRALCGEPAFFEEDRLCLVLLLAGDSAQISCALHALRLRPEHEEAVAEALLTALAGQPFAEVADRVVEIHAQASLVPGVRTILAGALLDLSVEAADDDRLGEGGRSLIQATRRDARFFRHSFLAADVAEAVGGRHPELAEALRRDLFEGFAATFTPAGVAHPLNDQAFALKIGGVLAARGEVDPDSVADVMTVGEQLGDLAEHLSIGSPAGLSSRFYATFSRTLLAAARHAWGDRAGSDNAIGLYGALAHLAVGPARRLLGQGFFGALDSRISDGDEQPITRELLLEAGRMEAGGTLHKAVLHQTGANLRAIGGPIKRTLSRPEAIVAAPPGPVQGAPFEQAPKAQDAAAAMASVKVLSAAATYPEPAVARVAEDLRVPALNAQGRTTPFAVAIRLLAGVELLSRFLSLPLRLVGYRHTGNLELTDEELRFDESTRVAGVTLRSRSGSVPVANLTAVRTAPSPASVYRVFGVGLLLTGASFGMVTFFDGLKASRFDLAVAGVALGVLGMLLDGACHRAWRSARDESVLTIERNGAGPALAWRLDGAHAETLLRRLGA